MHERIETTSIDVCHAKSMLRIEPTYNQMHAEVHYKILSYLHLCVIEEQLTMQDKAYLQSTWMCIVCTAHRI